MTTHGTQGSEDDEAAALDAAVEHAAHVLPAQDPIGNFVHHNTLHAYQHLPFHEALRSASALHDAECYLPEARYREALAVGRIAERDLDHALSLRAREVDDETLGPLTRRTLERLVLRHGLPDREAIAAVHEAAPARRALLACCERLAPRDPPPHAALLARTGRDRTLRDLLLALGAADPGERANAVLIDFLGAYLDAGMARWSMPARARGLLASFYDYLAVLPRSLPRFLRRVLDRLAQAGLDGAHGARRDAARALSCEVLAELGVAPASFGSYVARSLLALPGWSGIVARLEHVPADRAPGAPPVSLLELTAIRLVLDAEACRACAAEVGYEGPLRGLVDFATRRFARMPRDDAGAAHALFGLCELATISADTLALYGARFAERACALLTAFDETTRRRLLHEAYERAHLREVLDAVALHGAARTSPAPLPPRFQVLFCIDDREEAIRRYFEELDPGHQTYGVAGFFGLAMRFRGIDDARDTSLCPVVITPGHTVQEAPLPEHTHTLAQRFRRRNAAARVRFELADSSRSLVRGAMLTALLGTLAAVPLALRVLFPSLAARGARWLAARALPAPKTQLVLERLEREDRIESALGFTVAEQAERVAGTLENIGLVRDFAPLVAVLGHGASTVNNPHHSAYDCGACGGRNGGPNGRAFAAMANAPRVRALLRERGIDIPATTWFVGGFHDTTTDGVHLADLDRVPPAFRGALQALQAALDEARAQSALERCRKFEHAPRTLTPHAALRHVEERAVDLSQARPELGHATNAACIVGRRALSQGLFLDRRAFLVSYDASLDPDLRILQRILGAAVPVGAGINLEYYFSSVDNDAWGSGTKLPHNLAGLLGVMEGSTGDLRTGLPRQMVEIHDPVRLLSIIEAAPEAILEVAGRNPELAELVTNGWVRVASVHPDTGAIAVFEAGAFHPYTPSATALGTVSSAVDWYRGQLGFLPPVRIIKSPSRAA